MTRLGIHLLRPGIGGKVANPERAMLPREQYRWSVAKCLRDGCRGQCVFCGLLRTRWSPYSWVSSAGVLVGSARPRFNRDVWSGLGSPSAEGGSCRSTGACWVPLQRTTRRPAGAHASAEEAKASAPVLNLVGEYRTVLDHVTLVCRRGLTIYHCFHNGWCPRGKGSGGWMLQTYREAFLPNGAGALGGHTFRATAQRSWSWHDGHLHSGTSAMYLFTAHLKVVPLRSQTSATELPHRRIAYPLRCRVWFVDVHQSHSRISDPTVPAVLEQ